jgi:hypothetical protein
MINQQHPITPPPELVQQWGHDANLSGVPYDDETGHWAYEQHIAKRAAQWGADQELDACCEWVKGRDWTWTPADLRAARRPKPLSLKEQALAELERYEAEEWCEEMTFDSSIIRRALEQLDD